MAKKLLWRQKNTTAVINYKTHTMADVTSWAYLARIVTSLPVVVDSVPKPWCQYDGHVWTWHDSYRDALLEDSVMRPPRIYNYDLKAPTVYHRALRAREEFLKTHADDRHAHPADWKAWVGLDDMANNMFDHLLSSMQCGKPLPPYSLFVNAQFIGVFGLAALALRHGIWQASTFAPRVYLPQPYILT